MACFIFEWNACCQRCAPFVEVVFQVIRVYGKRPVEAQDGFLSRSSEFHPAPTGEFIRAVRPGSERHCRNRFHHLPQMLFVPSQLLNVRSIESTEQRDAKRDTERTKPPGGPPRRQDLDSQFQPRLAPSPTTRCPLHVEGIFSGRKGRISY